MELCQTVPWGRSFDEYVRMFALSERDLGLSIVGCGDGPAAFNAEMTRRGNHIVSVDPLYRFSATEIAARVREIADEVVERARRKADAFLWTDFRSPEDLGRRRLGIMQLFLTDYEVGLAAELVRVPYEFQRGGNDMPRVTRADDGEIALDGPV